MPLICSNNNLSSKLPRCLENCGASLELLSTQERTSFTARFLGHRLGALQELKVFILRSNHFEAGDSSTDMEADVTLPLPNTAADEAIIQ
ncbi:hypothetical protein D5086_002488 [Populus alba]|uniref:Uncharacterized protein n=1 Tax=Populus alba TaxID=43335 RepID=A0ACC4D1N2_POPAL